MECDHLTLSDLDRHLIAQAVANSTRVYLAPMDKGLSGSSVWQARWRLLDGRLSKLHVFKIGVTEKLEAEESAIIDIASVIDKGFPQTRLYRASEGRALLRQEFAGNAEGTTFSLRNYIRRPEYAANAHEIVNILDRLYQGRMSAWHYGDEETSGEMRSIDTAVPWWRPKIDLRKVAEEIGFHPLNSELVRIHGLSVDDLSAMVDSLLSIERPMCIGPVHGDLHATNVNLDDNLNVYLIDYGNTTYSWRAIDFIILEAAIKFATTPAHAPLESLLACERLIDDGAAPAALADGSYYGDELRKTLAACVTIRGHCVRSHAEPNLDNYRAGLVSVCAAFTSIEWMVNRRFLFHSIAYHLKRMNDSP